MRPLLLLPAALVTCACLASAGGQAADQPERRERVERGLRTSIAVKGAPAVRHTLADRMAELKVPGVSIAVVEDGRVAWARGYGQIGRRRRR